MYLFLNSGAPVESSHCEKNQVNCSPEVFSTEFLKSASPAGFPAYAAIYAARDWRMCPGIERVYVNAKARDALGWRPRHDLGTALARLAAGEETVSPLARRIGTKGYHDGEVAGRPSPLR